MGELGGRREERLSTDEKKKGNRQKADQITLYFD